MMNREKENELPQMQVGFIDSICLPIYEAFSHLDENLVPLVNGVRKNRKQWTKLSQELQDKKQSKKKIHDKSVDLNKNNTKYREINKETNNLNAKKCNNNTMTDDKGKEGIQKKINNKQNQQKPGNNSSKNIKKSASEFQLASSTRVLNNYKPHSKSTSCIHECDRTKVSNANIKATTNNRVQRKNNNRNYMPKVNDCCCKIKNQTTNLLNNITTKTTTTNTILSSSSSLGSGENHSIPKIVGKLGNIDNTQYLALTSCLDPAHNHQTSLATTSLSFLPDAAIALRRHSETNRLRSEINL